MHIGEKTKGSWWGCGGMGNALQQRRYCRQAAQPGMDMGGHVYVRGGGDTHSRAGEHALDAEEPVPQRRLLCLEFLNLRRKEGATHHRAQHGVQVTCVRVP